MTPKDTPTMSATELRATLSPLVKVFKALSELSERAEEVIAEETRLVSLRKEHGDLTKSLTAMKADRDKLTADVRTLHGQLDKAQADHKTADDELKAKRAQLDKVVIDQSTKLTQLEEAHNKNLQQAVKTQQRELDQLRADRAGVEAELTAAKNRLADFHKQLESLKK